MYKVILGIMTHTPGSPRKYEDTHVKAGFEDWNVANEWRINHPLFSEDNVYTLIVPYDDDKI